MRFEANKKEMIIHFLHTYVRSLNTEYGGDTAEINRKLFMKDVKDRYNHTQVMVKRFLRIQYGHMPASFRWRDILVQDRYINELIIEGFISLASADLFEVIPLHLAENSWVVRNMVQTQLRNLLKNGPPSPVSI